jgi:hypothetical protein
MSKTVLKKKMDAISPLVELRKITQLSQGKFSRLIGVSFDLVQSVEGNRARATENLFLRIRLETGGVWDETRGRWLIDSSICLNHLGVEPGTPLNLELFERFRELKGRCISDEGMKKDNAEMSDLVAEFHLGMDGEFWIEFVQRWSAAMETLFGEMKQKMELAQDDLKEELDRARSETARMRAKVESLKKKAQERGKSEERTATGLGHARNIRPAETAPATGARR